MKDKKIILYVMAGSAIGLVNGFLGGGGGVFCFATLCALYKLDTKSAHATSLYVILPVCLISAIVYLFSGYVDFLLTLIATTGICIGAFIGAKLLNKLSNFALNLIYAIILLLSALQMFVAS